MRLYALLAVAASWRGARAQRPIAGRVSHNRPHALDPARNANPKRLDVRRREGPVSSAVAVLPRRASARLLDACPREPRREGERRPRNTFLDARRLRRFAGALPASSATSSSPSSTRTAPMRQRASRGRGTARGSETWPRSRTPSGASQRPAPTPATTARASRASSGRTTPTWRKSSRAARTRKVRASISGVASSTRVERWRTLVENGES